MRRVSALFVLGSLLACGRVARAAPPPAWEPAKTWAILIGILEWEKPGLASFPKPGRVDRVLEATLLARGVPAAQVTFLEDRAATLAACREALAKTARAAGEGSTLVVYYAGHGVREGGKTYVTPYDTDANDCAATALSTDEIEAVVRREWIGSRLFLFADCCYSGAFAAVVDAYERVPRVRAAALLSAVACNVSTGQWTFTESVVASLRGEGVVDRDDDGFVDFAEADAHVHREMRFREAQLAEARRTTSFEPTLRLASVPPQRRRVRVPGAWQVGDHVEAEWKGTWWRARVLDANEERVKIRWHGYDASHDTSVPPSRLRAPAPIAVETGAAVEVEWKGKWWPAKVLKAREDFALVHYDEFGDEWDEWVTAKRLRERKAR